MPQFQPITLGDKVFTPDQISSVTASAQDLTSGLASRDRLVFDRNVGEGGNGKPYRRVVRVQLHKDVGTEDNPKVISLTGTFTVVFPADATSAHRGEIMDQMSAALANTDIRASVQNPEWFF